MVTYVYYPMCLVCIVYILSLTIYSVYKTTAIFMKYVDRLNMEKYEVRR